MKVLIIPDVHLKPWIFHRAEELLKEGAAERAVCLMDLPDEWRMDMQLDLYQNTFDTAIAFAKKFPESIFVYGNHDLSYKWDQLESGYSIYAADLVEKKLQELEAVFPKDNQITYIRRIDNVLFCHGGLTHDFVRRHVPIEKRDDIDAVIEEINKLTKDQMWSDNSPIWHRPNYFPESVMYGEDPERYLQVVGHTPVVGEVKRCRNVIACDSFSLDSFKKPIGSQKYTIVDTKTWEFTCVK